jgi:hypothetical protein
MRSSSAANVLARVFTGLVAICFPFAAAGLAQSTLPAGEPQTPAASGLVRTVMSAPRLVKFSAALKDPTGQPLTGVAGVTFAIYKDPQGGTPLWQETQNVQLDGQGNYAALLGSATSEGLPVELFNSGESRWLGVQALAPGAEEQTRVLLVSVPYALKAADADTVGGMPLSAFVLTSPRGGVWSRASSRMAAQAAAAAGTANVLPKWNNDGTLTDSAVFESGGKVGINTKTPAAALDVAGLAGAPGNVKVSGLIDLPNTSKTAAGPTGVISLGGSRFLHNAGGNTFLGANAGNFDTRTFSNTGLGDSVLHNIRQGRNNTAIGHGALAADRDGGANTAVGLRSLASSDESFNTAVGYRALWRSTGRYNIAIGSEAGAEVTTGSDNIYVGSSGAANDSATIRIGDSSQKKTFIAGISGVNVNGAQVVVDQNGQLGIKQSSRQFKYDIQNMGYASDKLHQLRPVTFRYKQAGSDGSHPIEYGLIAEEVAEVYPELVQYAPTGDANTVLYHVLPAMLLNEVQKQHQQIEIQQHQHAAQAAELADLKVRLEALAPGPAPR